MSKHQAHRALAEHSDTTSGRVRSKPRTDSGSRNGRTVQLSTTREVGAKEGEPGSWPKPLMIGHREKQAPEMSTDDLLNLGEPKPPSKATRSGQTLVSSSASKDKDAGNGLLTRSNSIQSDKDFRAETRHPRKPTSERNDSKVPSHHAKISTLARLPPREEQKREQSPLVPDRSRNEGGKSGAGDSTRPLKDVASSAASSTSSLHRVDSAAKPGQHTGRKHPDRGSSIASNGSNDLSRITSFSSAPPPLDDNMSDTTFYQGLSPHELEFVLNKQSKENGGSNDSKPATTMRRKAHAAQSSSESPRVTKRTHQKPSRWGGFGPLGERELPPVDIDESKVYTPASFDAWSNSTFSEVRARKGGQNR